jgi:hypothetical protein
MDDRFLAEQLKRIRHMSEQMSEAQRRLVQGSERARSEHQVPEDPFQAVHDYRPYGTHDYALKQSSATRRNAAHDTPRRRRRR